MTFPEIVSNQVRYNLIDRTIELSLLKYCRQQKITVIAHSPLASGPSASSLKIPRGFSRRWQKADRKVPRRWPSIGASRNRA